MTLFTKVHFQKGGTGDRISLIAILGLVVIPALVYAEPVVSSVVRSADGSPGLARNDYGTIYGSGLSDATYVSAQPWPVKLGKTEVYICASATDGLGKGKSCVSANVIFASPGQVNFYAPTVATGTYLSVTVDGIIDTQKGSRSYQIGLSTAPAIFEVGFDCFIEIDLVDAGKSCGLSWDKPGTQRAIRGAVTDLSGKIIDSSNPARLGQFVVIWTTGFPTGSKPSGVTIGGIPIGPPYSNCCYSRTAIASYAGESGFPGLFQINLQVPVWIAGNPGDYPPLFRCGSYKWEVAFSTGPPSVWVDFPITVLPGDAPCTP